MKLFSAGFTDRVALFLVHARCQNGFLCRDFYIALLQSCFSRYKVVFLDFCVEYKHDDGMTFSPDLELMNSFRLALICSGNG
jgi:hypothetical protein